MNISSASCGNTENGQTLGNNGAAEYPQTECPEAEYTECPEAECTECPEAEPCECIVPTYSTTNTTAAEQAHTQSTGRVRALEEDQQTRTESCTAIGGGLGALAVVLALTLVGVVLGWVWQCRRNKGFKNR